LLQISLWQIILLL